MKTLVQYHLPSGETLVAEVEDDDDDSVRKYVSRRSRGDDLVVESQNRLGQIADVVIPTARMLRDQIASMECTPDEVEVEFGVKLTVSAGAVIAATGMEGNIRVNLHWRH